MTLGHSTVCSIGSLQIRVASVFCQLSRRTTCSRSRICLMGGIIEGRVGHLHHTRRTKTLREGFRKLLTRELGGSGVSTSWAQLTHVMHHECDLIRGTVIRFLGSTVSMAIIRSGVRTGLVTQHKTHPVSGHEACTTAGTPRYCPRRTCGTPGLSRGPVRPTAYLMLVSHLRVPTYFPQAW